MNLSSKWFVLHLVDTDDLYFCLIKVSLLVVVEIGVFPLICGWWLDICSLVSCTYCHTISFQSFKKSLENIPFKEKYLVVYLFLE